MTKEYRSVLCIITTVDDIDKAARLIDKSYSSVAVIHPSVTIDSRIDLDRTSVNVMTKDEYMAACNWHFDHTT